MDFKATGSGNEVLDAGDFFVSFRGNTRNIGFGGVGFPLVSAMFEGDDDGAGETALCRDGKYLILNGDFRDDYRRLAPEGWEACVDFFKEHSDQKSFWSNEIDEAAE